MMRSLYSGVSGLTSHQTKMDVIGNNIANVNTIGFKGSSVTFSDLMYQTTGSATQGTEAEGGVDPSQIGYGTQVASITKNMSRSSFQSTTSTTDIAIAGDGFIQVQDKAGNNLYTRAGSLTVDDYGNLVDSSGKFVLGTVNADPTDASGLAEAAGSSKIVIDVPSVNTVSGTPAAATTMSTTTAPLAAAAGATAGTFNYTLSFMDGNQLEALTIDIQTGTTDGVVYDETVTPATLTVTIADMSSIKTLEALEKKVNALIDAEMTKTGSTMADFKGGEMSISYTSTTTVPVTLSATQKTALENDIVNFITLPATAAITTDAPVATEQSKKNLTSFTISESGVLIGVHPVLGTLTFGRIDLATFNNPTGLEESGNSYFSETVASGEASVAVPGYDGSGALVTGALEMSNVNLAQEFSDMIVAQRGFQANSRIITTSDSMLEELVNLKR